MANDAGAGSAINLEVELLGSLQKEHQHCLRVAKCQNGVIGVYLVRPLQDTIGLQWCFHPLPYDCRSGAKHYTMLSCSALLNTKCKALTCTIYGKDFAACITCEHVLPLLEIRELHGDKAG